MDGHFDKRLTPPIAAFPAIALLLDEDLKRSLKARGKAPRSATDDALFSQFNTSMAIGLTGGLSSYYVNLFKDIEETTLRFEHTFGTEVHKGSIYFNAAICCLFHGDFDSAMYYFSQAANEDVATHGKATADIFLSNALFKRSVLDRLHELLKAEAAAEGRLPSGIFPPGYSAQDIDSLLAVLPVGQLSSLIVVLCRCVSHRAFRKDNTGTSTLLYRLVADLCIVFEASIKDRVRRSGGTPEPTLGKLIRNDLTSTSLGDLSRYCDMTLYRSNPKWQCASMADYDRMLLRDRLLDDIDTETNKLQQAAKLLVFVAHTRNQVAHDMDASCAIFNDTQLCRRVARRVLIAIWLIAYL